MATQVLRARGRAATVLALATLACREPQAVAPATPAPTPLPYPNEWRFHTEEEWLVAQTTEAIAGIVQFAAGKAMPPPLVISVVRAPLVDPLAPRRFAVKLASGAFAVDEIELYINDHIWSAEAFAALARQLVANGADSAPVPTPRPGGRAVKSTLPATLLALRVENLERENQRVSAALATAPLDPMLHQEAALLLAAFALREVGWHFGDPRVALCRLAAHLALARLAGSDATTSSGRLAEIALDVLALRQASAVARLAAFQPASPAEEGWARALRMGATGDWRPLQRPERASLLERLIYARTLAERLDMNRAQEFLDRGGRDRVADWRRLMLGAHATLTVETCNRYRGWGLLEEEAELLAVWRLHRGSDLDPELWLEALGMDPAPSPVLAGQAQLAVRVIDLGLWMAFERRQVLSQLLWDVRCLGGLGLPEQERVVRKSSAHDYGGLETYPLVASEHNPEAQPDSAARMAAADLVRRRPDLVNAFMWVNLSQGTALGPASPALPPYALWFDPYSPFGTAFDAFNRAGRAQFRPLRRSDYATVPVAQAELAPYQYQLRWKLCQARGGRIVNPNPGLEAMEVVYKETADYDAWALRALLSGAQKWSKPDAYRRYGTQLCDLLVDGCNELAHWLVEQKEDEAAAEMYRKWARGARDRVEVSQGIEWLVNYEYDHGRRPEAFRLAREAAQVYSHSGLNLLASLSERAGDLSSAETYYRKAWDRYEGSLELVFFYHRHRSEPRLRAGIRRLERELFPNGLPRLAGTLPTEAPEDGVLITESSPRQLEAGLRIGQIIVGLDGYRVRNLREYNWIRWLAEGDTPMTLTIWDGARYRVVKASPENRTFGGSFDNYRPPDQ